MNRDIHLLELDLQVLREGLWRKSCCCLMGSVWGDKAQERERVYSCNVCDQAFKSIQMPSQLQIWQQQGNVFVCKGSTPTTASTDTISLCLASLTTGRVFATSCGTRTTIEEIILNLGGGGEEEDGSGQFQEEGRHPLPSQMEIYCVGF